MLRLLESPEPSETDVLKQRIEELESQLQDAEQRVREAQQKGLVASRATVEIRRQLSPLYSAMKALFGELDSFSEAAPEQSASGPLSADRYAPWKAKFRGKAADMIDALMKYEGGLNRRQLAKLSGMAYPSGGFNDNIFKLHNAGLIEKNGDIIRLKRL